MIGEFVILRCKDAGVHMGTLKQLNGRSALVEDCRRLWYWTGAFTLNEAAIHGVGEASRISEPVGQILLLEVCEIIKCTKKAKDNLSRSRNGS